MTENKNWGEFSMLMASGIGIGLVGIFADSTVTYTTQTCAPTTKSSLDPDDSGGSDQKDNSKNAATSLENVNQCLSGAAVAIGTGVSIIIFALCNKFNLLNTPRNRSIFLLIVASALIIIGGISLSIKLETVTDSGVDYLKEKEKVEKNLASQSRLGGIVLGFGLGIIMVMIPKLIIALVAKGELQTNSEKLEKANQLTVAGSTFLSALFATIIGSWSWNIYNKCSMNEFNPLKEKMPGDGARGITGFATVMSALLCVYAAVFFILRASNHPAAKIMSNFSKIKSAAASGLQSANSRMAGKNKKDV